MEGEFLLKNRQEKTSIIEGDGSLSKAWPHLKNNIPKKFTLLSIEQPSLSKKNFQNNIMMVHYSLNMLEIHRYIYTLSNPNISLEEHYQPRALLLKTLYSPYLRRFLAVEQLDQHSPSFSLDSKKMTASLHHCSILWAK